MIRNYEDLARVLSAEANEDSISRQVYRDTSCGAWASFTTVAGHARPQTWKVEITPSILGVLILRGKRRGKDWVSPDKFPRELQEFLGMTKTRGRVLLADIRTLDALRVLEKAQAPAPPLPRDPVWSLSRNNVLTVRGVQVPGPGRPGVALGSIVEGVERTTQTITLEFPFTLKRWNEALEDIEEEADEIWRETHGCEACGPENECGYREINSSCKECGGEGTVL